MTTEKKADTKTAQGKEVKLSAVEQMIEKFNQKHLLVEKLNVFKHSKKTLSEVKFQETKNGDFESPQPMILKLFGDDSYNSKDLFKISNPAVIKDVIQFVISRIDVKIDSLEKELLKD